MWFDGQAEQFDDCAGLDPPAGRAIARAVVGLSGCAAGDVLLDVGTGTGAVGVYFADLPLRYLGLDRSRPMLEVFRRKLGAAPPHLLLVQADSDRQWPVRDGAVAVVFASRVVHQLDAEHFLREVRRVGRRGGLLLLGRVERPPDSLPSQLQRRKRDLLAEHGVRTRPGRKAVRQMVERCQE